jgi:hypothetical protein
MNIFTLRCIKTGHFSADRSIQIASDVGARLQVTKATTKLLIRNMRVHTGILRLPPSGMEHYVFCCTDTNVSQETKMSVFENCENTEYYIFTKLHGVTSQKCVVWVLTALRTPRPVFVQEVTVDYVS